MTGSHASCMEPAVSLGGRAKPLTVRSTPTSEAPSARVPGMIAPERFQDWLPGQGL